jgi:hypothetical protein
MTRFRELGILFSLDHVRMVSFLTYMGRGGNLPFLFILKVEWILIQLVDFDIFDVSKVALMLLIY